MPARTASVEDRLRKVLGDGLLTQEPLRLHTTFRIGGPADFFFAARTPDAVVQALRAAHAIGLPVFLLGGGSNLLVSDDGFRGLVVHNACDAIEFDGTAAHVEGGADFTDFILRCRDRGIAGLEFALPRGVWRPLWELYVRVGLPAAGRLLSSGWAEVGDFLGPSIRSFYERYPEERLHELWWDAGVRDARSRRLSLGGGIVTWGHRA